MNMFAKALFLLLLAVGMLASCSSFRSTPAPPPVTTLPATPTWLPTSTAAPVSTVAFLPTFSLATLDPSMLPTITPTSVVESPFEFVATLDELLPGSQAAEFLTASDGSLWMSTNVGIARLSDSGWTAYLSKREGHFVGIDTLGRAWSINPTNMVMTESCSGPSGPCFINPDMDSISAWDGTKWTRYSSESGWTNFSVPRAPGPNFSMAELDGQIWISTSVDVRVFDGSRWKVIKLKEIGLTPPYSLLTIQAFAGTKEVWIIGCDFTGSGPNRSEIYGYDGSKWENRSVPEENSGCLLRVHEDRQGNVWLTADETLWRFTRATEEWVKFTPPAPDSSPNYIRVLALNKAGEPWLTTMSSNRPILHHLQNGVWSPIIQFNSLIRSASIFIDSDDRVWIPTPDGIYQVVDDQPRLVSHLDIAAPLTMDSTGRIWVVGRDSSSPNDKLSLWVTNP